ncbi:MAG: GTPase domain-containing protein [Rhodobacteraceae bacterium]|nr:GTPase domain-containing protein [Paracoccaceae bacterium]
MELNPKKLEDLLDKSQDKLSVGCVGIAVLGSTGAGKTTLVNAFFPNAKAETGYGAPIIQDAEWFPKKRDKCTRFRILDTRGFEEKDYEETVEAALEAVDETNESEDRNDHAHIAWLVIKEGSGRVQDSHKDIATRFTEAGIPVIAVLTEAIADDEEFRGEVRKLLPEVKDVIRVNSIPKSTRAGTIESFGLDILFRETLRFVPEEENAIALMESADKWIVAAALRAIGVTALFYLGI